MGHINDLLKELKENKSSQRAKISKSFFKTGLGEYGEGDIFWGISVPINRKISKQYYDKLTLKDIETLLSNKVHEIRLSALFLLVKKYQVAKKLGDIKEQKKIVDFYLNNTVGINNWDLVDLSCYHILGDWILYFKEDRKILNKLIKSQNLRERRIAIVSCYSLIKSGLFDEFLGLSIYAIKDNHELIHKAYGWMLREVGKKDLNTLISFLDINSSIMPRVMLRYSIEKLDPKTRQYYMTQKGDI